MRTPAAPREEEPTEISVLIKTLRVADQLSGRGTMLGVERVVGEHWVHYGRPDPRRRRHGIYSSHRSKIGWTGG